MLLNIITAWSLSPSPSNQSATAQSISSIALNWTSDATYSNVIVVVSTVGYPDDLTQGTQYTQGTGDINSSAGYILYVGSDDYSVTDFVHNGLNDNTTYYYKFFTANNNYYSAAVTASATTHTAYRTAQNGDWNTASTWVGGVVPPDTAECFILHHITISSATDTVRSIKIFNGKSLTLNASANLTVNGTITNYGMLKTNDNSAVLTINGTLDNKAGASVNMVGDGLIKFTSGSAFNNSGSFTSGLGTISFLGDGSATGTLIFHNLIIAGNVDLGDSASVSDTLKLTSSGNLINNSIKYLTGSVLVFDRNFSLADDRFWYRNTANSDTEQVGIPWNVIINSSYTINISDEYFRAINGNFTNNGTFELGTSIGADFHLRGDFINNGTFTHNNRTVEFDGNTLQTILGNTQTFGYVTIKNPANVALNCDITIENDLNFSNGKIILGANNLTLNGSINGNTSSMYVVTNDTGYLIQSIDASSSKTYPIGTISSYYPATLAQGSSASTDNLGVRVQNSIDNAVNIPTKVVNVQWTINEATAGGNELTTTFQWNTTDEASEFDHSGTVETRYYSGGYLPTSPTPSTVTNSDPVFRAEAGDVYTGNLSNLPFIIANPGAFADAIKSNGTGGGLWSDASSWQGGIVPSANDSCIILSGDSISLNLDTTVKSISIQNGGILNCQNYKLTINNGGAIANSGKFYAGTGKVVFAGNGAISTGAINFYDVELNGAVNFSSNTSITDTLTMNAGSSINKNAPFFISGSTLKYNQGGNVNRSYEWLYNISESDPGYPANVRISNNTNLNIDVDDSDDYYYQIRAIKGDLTIDAGSSIDLGDMGGGTTEDKICGLYVKGNIVNNGTMNLSSNFGGDILLDGDITNNGTINWNSRAIFFTGPKATNQNIYGLTTIPFILINNGSNVVLHNNITVNGSGSEFITFARPSSTYPGSIDLNGNNLVCAGTGNIELNDIAGAKVTGTGRVEVSGGDATFDGINSGTLEFGTDVTLAINGGTMTFPSSLGIVTIYGTLEIGDNATISNIPTYGNNSTLHYKKGGSFTMGVEWGAGSDIADNIPFNVTISQGSTPDTLLMNATRYILGTLLIQNNATMLVAADSGQLTVNDLTVDAGGSIILKSPADNGPTGSFISTGTVQNNGTMIAERYVSAGMYSFISPPNSNTNSKLFTDNPNGYFNPNFYKYDESFDAQTDPPNSTYEIWHDAQYGFDSAWIYAHDGQGGAGVILDVPGRGYAYYNDIPRTFKFNGTFNNGDQTIKLYYHNNDNNNNQNGGYFDGWNLIANPYPSALDWTNTAWDKTYVDGTIYFWDGTYSNLGNYKYYNNSAYDDGTNVVNGASQYIPAMQAFFVKANPSAGVAGQDFTIPNSARVHSTQHFWTKSTAPKNNKKTSQAFIRLKAQANNSTDELVVRYINEGTINYDRNFDAYKMYSPSPTVPQIYTYNKAGGAGFAINSLPVSSINDTLSIGFEIAKATNNCQISLSEYKANNLHIIFEDKTLLKKQNLISNPTYTFNADSADIRNRFYIYFEQNTAPQAVSNVDNFTYNYNDSIKIHLNKNAFYDKNFGDTLTFNLTLADGEKLPYWIKFDKKNLNIQGLALQVGTYNLKYTATDIMGQSASVYFKLTVKALLPKVNTLNVENITNNNAYVSGQIAFNGGTTIDEAGFVFDTVSNPTIYNHSLVSTIESNNFTSYLTNLNPGETYYLRAYAKNSAGLQYGNELNFTTNSLIINNIKDNALIIYPIPATNKLNIVSKNRILSVRITSLSGKTILTKKLNTQPIVLNISDLDAGVYFIEIKTLKKSIVKKFVKE